MVGLADGESADGHAEEAARRRNMVLRGVLIEVFQGIFRPLGFLYFIEYKQCLAGNNL
jgi:hypothetical protein